MTVVLARRFGDQIEIVADTMISNTERGREEAIPGRLKIITISSNLTVAYAGHSDPALYAIRRLFRDGIVRGTEATESLRLFTDSPDHDVEFIIASHQPRAELRKVWLGRCSQPLDQAWLGNPTISRAVEERLQRSGDASSDGTSFWSAFIEAFTSDRVRRGTGVGGLPIGLKATATGHAYRLCSYHEDRSLIEFLAGTEQHQNPNTMQTGDWTYHFTIVPLSEPGLAVLGAHLQQARRSYIYSPLLDDDPIRVTVLEPGIDWTENQVLMNDRTSVALSLAAQRLKAAKRAK